MKTRNLFLLGILFAFIFVSSCKKDETEEPVVINESEVLVQYLESTNSPYGKDYVATDMPSIISASELKTLNTAGQAYIIDIRDAADFANGHIENAVNVTVANLLTHVKGLNMANYTKVAIVCYSGQTSAFATSLMRIMGYDKVWSLKWGMCSWNSTFAGPWNNAIANGNAYASQFVTTPTDKAAKGNLPTLSTGKTTGKEILEARVAALLTEGYTPARVANTAVFGNLAGYYIVNYWPAAQYADPGHIPGAMQYTPKESMKLAADLKTLPTNKPIVLYCYTGQTSSFLAAYLRLLGYDAKSLLFGGNAMIYDLMVSKNMTVFKPSEIMEYDYVTP
ncbi:MAG TPA: rhodanese-like domain-containing protein [Bacteroidales bacterium]|nr:rhodanese-like domain-containing protein [Bacteroidales bacterium]